MTRLYDSAKWQRLRAWQLANHPLCRMCMDAGKYTSARVVDHIVPHRGDPAVFHDQSNLQSLCAACHDRVKQSEERRGFSRAVGSDGRPVDPRHPANTGKVWAREWDASAWVPPDVPRLGIPSVLVCGPPAAGKTTWVRTQEADGTLILDPDWTARELDLPASWTRESTRANSRRIATREMARLMAAERMGYERAIIARSAPRALTRIRWKEMLGPLAKVKVIDTSERECIRRIKADPERVKNQARQVAAVKAWWKTYRE